MRTIGDWRYVYASVAGVAHRASGGECQDACAVHWLALPDAPPALLLTAADGAGSAAQARVGAELACQTLLTEWAAALAQTPANAWTRDTAEALIAPVQAALNWLISQPNVCVVAGTRHVEHLRENLGALGWRMQPQDIELLRSQYHDQTDVSEVYPLR